MGIERVVETTAAIGPVDRSPDQHDRPCGSGLGNRGGGESGRIDARRMCRVAPSKGLWDEHVCETWIDDGDVARSWRDGVEDGLICTDLDFWRGLGGLRNGELT